MKARQLLLLVCIFALATSAYARQFAVVADNDNTSTNLTSAELVKIFSGHTRTWADGKPVKIILRDPNSAEMELAARKLFNMTGDQARAFARAHSDIMTIADSDEAVIRFVATTRGAIGLVDLYSLTKDVSVIKVDGKLPVEQGYFLRGN
ncbi:MAG: substrate-binding domain-containing protein [Acidobacteriaceae bacterium]|jgi:ABC-type phosphate transport system substrate-binding protein|nr:substrate-binding domain-containing protein [Acidobacteriaceae bacterium]